MPFIYAQLNSEDVCSAIVEMQAESNNPKFVLLAGFDTTVLGKKRVADAWEIVPEAVDWKITQFALMRRFTEDEWIELDLSSIDTPAGSPATRKASARVRRALLLLRSDRHVDLKFQETRDQILAMCQLLQSKGVITDASVRAAQLLDSAPSADELA